MYKLIADDLEKVLNEAKLMGCNNVEAFRHIPLENVQTVITALNKQIPRKVVFVHPLQYNDNGDYMCPTCNHGTVYNAYGHQSTFCPYCGQKLDWSE